jgi:hypothetical protein
VKRSTEKRGRSNTKRIETLICGEMRVTCLEMVIDSLEKEKTHRLKVSHAYMRGFLGI